jgi:hypothetical protein
MLVQRKVPHSKNVSRVFMNLFTTGSSLLELSASMQHLHCIATSVAGFTGASVQNH